ncbi:MAG: tyrosine-type recombinase/integrase [Leptospira sp.]|nr:tyrosine-type recombinase/integrase [Leptospira sp.]
MENGKGSKQRYTILSDQAIVLLENYIKFYTPTSYLFFSNNSTNSPESIRRIQSIFQKIAKTANIIKKIKVHTLRHSFTTHLMEDGYSLFYIQKLLGTHP